MSHSATGIIRNARSFRRALHQDFYNFAEANHTSQTRCFCLLSKNAKCSGGRIFNPLSNLLASEKNINIHQRCISSTHPRQVIKENHPSTHDTHEKKDHKSNCETTSVDEISKKDLNLVVEATLDEENGDDLDSSNYHDHLSDIPGATTGRGKKLAIVFTCSVCNTRSAKKFSEQAYLNGLVMVRCPGCENLHLIADRLGYFEDRGEDGKGWDIEKLMKDMGDNVKAVNSDNVLELTLEDILGKTKLEELQNDAVQGNGNERRKK